VTAYEVAFPGAAKWLFDEAARNSNHVRTMELQAIALQRRDRLLHRLLPFGLVLAFLLASTVVALFASVALGSVGIGVTIGAVMIAYLTGRSPSG
jgi:uncharacterized membrane protein